MSSFEHDPIFCKRQRSAFYVVMNKTNPNVMYGRKIIAETTPNKNPAMWAKLSM